VNARTLDEVQDRGAGLRAADESAEHSRAAGPR
jgi:hypothetical protein